MSRRVIETIWQDELENQLEKRRRVSREHGVKQEKVNGEESHWRTSTKDRESVSIRVLGQRSEKQGEGRLKRRKVIGGVRRT